MSRKTTQFRRRIAQMARTGRKDFDLLVPGRAVGTGQYLKNTPNAYGKGPHGTRNTGAVCSLPASEDTRARMMALTK